MTGLEHPSGWAAVADLLAGLGIDTVFGLPGDDLGFLAAAPAAGLRMVLCRDQRHAAGMATGYALATGRPGACVVGRGPAVTNAVTGLLEAFSARVPLLLFAEGTAADQRGTGAFQELDQVPLVAPVTRWAVRVEHPHRLCGVLRRAALVATGAAPGPVYVELADPVGSTPAPKLPHPWRSRPAPPPAPSPAALSEAFDLLRAARRPLLLVGGGARNGNRTGQIERLAGQLGAGVFTTASGRGAVDEADPLYCGLSGLYALPPLAQLWQDADLVVALGSRFEETARFGIREPVPPTVQVTLDPVDASPERGGAVVLGDVAAAVTDWLARLASHPGGADPAWAEQVRRARAKVIAEAVPAPTRTDGPVRVASLLATLDELLPPERIMVHENGLQDMWSYFFPYWTCRGRGGAVVPSEQTSLGFGAAAAAGVAAAGTGRPVVAFVGDGAFHLFSPELPTVADHQLAVLYVVLHNGGYGWLQANLDRATGGAGGHRFLRPGRSALAGMARTYGLEYALVDNEGALVEAIRASWAACVAGSGAVVEVVVDRCDVPPGMSELAGEFPLAPAGSPVEVRP